MKLTIASARLRTLKADVLAIFVRSDRDAFKQDINELRRILGVRLDHVIEGEEFKGKEGDCCTIYTERKLPAAKVLIIGLGETKHLTLERIRRAGATAAKKCSPILHRHLALVLPTYLKSEIASTGSLSDSGGALIEGAMLALYKYNKYLSDKKKQRLNELTLAIPAEVNAKPIRQALQRIHIICEATCRARDLENAPPSELYPETLAAAAKTAGDAYGFKTVIWDRKKIEQREFGGLLAVGSGSNRPPRFIILEHQAGRKDLPTIVLVGKGVTFDAGGISIKPASGMSEMKMDMSGAAAVIGVLEAVTRLDLPLHVVGLIPATENVLGGSAMRPGDIIRHFGGKTSEVDNTDAEGRLILADALAFASTYKPKAVIDLATLTGACVVALGHHATGMMGNDETLMARLKAAGEKTYERVWQLPLFEEYEKQIKSDVADVKNTGGRWGGAITAALFLKKFIGEYKWVHLDIAGTAILEEDLPYARKGGSGVGVRLLVEFLTTWK